MTQQLHSSTDQQKCILSSSKHIQKNVHHSVIHSSLKLEPAKMDILWFYFLMDNFYKGILYSGEDKYTKWIQMTITHMLIKEAKSTPAPEKSEGQRERARVNDSTYINLYKF